MIEIGKRIRNVREARHLKQTEFARRVGMTPGQLCLIEKGRTMPTFATVARVAREFDVTISSLAGETCEQKPEIPVAINAVGSGPLTGLLNKASASTCNEVEQIVAKRALSATSLPLKHHYLSLDGAGELLARELRSFIGAGDQPFSDLPRLLSFYGVEILGAKMLKGESQAAFWAEASQTLVIAVNVADTPERQLYSIVYALGAASLSLSTGRRPLEESAAEHRFLRQFAAEFLMPSTAVMAAVAHSGIEPEEWKFRDLLDMKVYFKVSAESFAIRLEELKLIVPELRVKYRDRLRAYYKTHPKAMEPQPRLPKIGWEK